MSLHRYGNVSLVALGMLLFIGTATASASPVSDIPDAINDSLFGGANLFAAQAVLTAAIMMSAGLLLAMLGLNYISNFIVLFCVLGGLTAVGWADPTLLLIAGLFVVAMFVKKVTTYMTGQGADSSEE